MAWCSGGGRIGTPLRRARDEEWRACSMISERCACGCDSSGRTVSARREDRSHARDTSAQGQAGRRGIVRLTRGLHGLVFSRAEAMAGSRKGEGQMEAFAGAGQFALGRGRPSPCREEAAHARHLKQVVEGHLGCRLCPICGGLNHIAAPARPATHLGASEPPTAKPEDLPRGWARDSTQWV